MTKAAERTSCGDWEFPLARPRAPGRNVYRRGSVRGVRSLCDNPVGIAKAREEYEDDKFAKSAVEIVRSRLAWWRKRAREHKVSPYPVTVEHLKLMGSLLKKAGYRSAGAYLSAVSGWDTLGRTLRTWSCVKANVRVREALGLPGSVVLSTCRSWRTWPLGATLCAREDPYFHARARCVALGGQC